MDLQTILIAIQQGINWLLAKLAEYTASWNEIQWLLLIVGALLVIYCIYRAWKAERIASYKLAVWGAKLGLTLIVLAFAWPYAVDIYRTAYEATGNPIISMLAVLAGGFLGYHVIKLLFKRRKEVV